MLRWARVDLVVGGTSEATQNGERLGDPTEVGLSLLVTLAGALTAVLADHPMWALVGWAVGGIAAVVLVAVKTRRES